MSSRELALEHCYAWRYDVRSDPTRSFRLASGDVLVMGGKARLAFHGIDRVLAGSSRLIPGGGRINLTLRRVTRR